MKTKHTEGPWEIVDSETPGEYLIYGKEGYPGGHIAEFHGPNAKADAEFAVLACNNHNKLKTERSELLMHLATVLTWACSGSRGNPYCMPETKAALKHLAKLVNTDDYLDVDLIAIIKATKDN